MTTKQLYRQLSDEALISVVTSLFDDVVGSPKNKETKKELRKAIGECFSHHRTKVYENKVVSDAIKHFFS